MRSDAARNRLKIIEVARAMIASLGPSVSMDAIAAEAGVAVGTLYRHHPTKAALVNAVIRDSVEQIGNAAVDAVQRVSDGADAADELVALFRVIAERYATDHAVKQAASTLGAYAPAAPPLVAPSGLPGEEDSSGMQRTVAAIQSLLDDGRAAGRLRGDLTVADLLVLLQGVPRADNAIALRERYVEIVLAGIRPNSGSADRA